MMRRSMMRRPMMRRMVAVVLALVFPAAAGADQRLGLADYRSELVALAEALERGDAEEAESLRVRLLACRVETPDGELLHPDASLLRPADGVSAARARARGLRLLARELVAVEAGPPADAELLAEIRRRQQRDRPAAGGEVEVPSPPFAERLWRSLTSLRDAVSDFRDWLFDFLGRWLKLPNPAGVPSASLDARSVGALVAVLALALLFFAWRVLRPPARTLPAAESEPLLSSPQDADPLSREGEEWQRYGRRLAADGRYREAVRAWFHAVLVTLYRRGLLHYRRGRTNWEYVAALSPELPWRGAMVELTRVFEAEWYGRSRSSAEALDRCAAAAAEVLRAVAGQTP
ncbi:MAG: DUF4129 domain-containing protein [bacterium]|nr:DUF4129 domain-containing protein [bacterium]